MDAPLLPASARRTAAWCAVVLLVAGVGALAVWLVVTFAAVVTPVLLALLGSALLGPLYRRMRAVKVQRSAAAALTCVALVVFVAGVGFVVVHSLLETGDEIVASLKEAARKLLPRLGASGTSLNDTIDSLKAFATKYGARAASGVVSGISIVGQLIATAVLALLLTFFFLRDGARFPALLREAAPDGTGPLLERIAHRAFAAVQGFMRGTTVIALIDAVLIGIGLLILRVPGAAGLAALVFVGAYIPYLGAFISGAVAVLVALADRGWVIGLWALGVVLAVQVLEGHVLQPIVQSRTVHMHPALVLLAITAGASLAGILGMLLAVPIAAAAFGALDELRHREPDVPPEVEGPPSHPAG
ncbi:AI-2E family transporter [Actinacidiphila glaucinigra]|uniref:AI-2E family transporter n=1 Tax=Actinacidiphila glaucinigra TaxID=235986 RepID=UPI000B778368|nr:AI-2E family transporter [Actinacidiphila glaucinigra]